MTASPYGQSWSCCRTRTSPTRLQTTPKHRSWRTAAAYALPPLSRTRSQSRLQRARERVKVARSAAGLADGLAAWLRARRLQVTARLQAGPGGPACASASIRIPPAPIATAGDGAAGQVSHGSQLQPHVENPCCSCKLTPSTARAGRCSPRSARPGGSTGSTASHDCPCVLPPSASSAARKGVFCVSEDRPCFSRGQSGPKEARRTRSEDRKERRQRDDGTQSTLPRPSGVAS